MPPGASPGTVQGHQNQPRRLSFNVDAAIHALRGTRVRVQTPAGATVEVPIPPSAGLGDRVMFEEPMAPPAPAESQFFFDPQSGYYYDAHTSLYYHPSTQMWYMKDPTTGELREYAPPAADSSQVAMQPPVAAPQPQQPKEEAKELRWMNPQGPDSISDGIAAKGAGRKRKSPEGAAPAPAEWGKGDGWHWGQEDESAPGATGEEAGATGEEPAPSPPMPAEWAEQGGAEEEKGGEEAADDAWKDVDGGAALADGPE